MADKFHDRRNTAGKVRVWLGCILIAVSLIGLAVMGGFWMIREQMMEGTQMGTQNSVSTSPSSSVPVSQPASKPSITKLHCATIGVSGDILLHNRLIKSGYNAETNTYDYNHVFSAFSQFVSQVDYAVANMEGTLCGDNNGYDYSGYPCFNAPDAIIDAAKNAGFDMLLTANNHSFDTRTTGFFRTQEIIKDRNLDYIGTRYTQEDKNYTVKNVNNINIGMINYTYNTGFDENGNASLNYIPLTAEATALVNSFSYDDLTGFYGKLSAELEAMKADGAEVIMLYIHWGDEYHTEANATQKKMAQALCDMGIDVIVGNHAHVPQPVELLTNTNDENQKTLCLYSTGNLLSNIRRGASYPAETEDGMLFQVTFVKYSDGTVLLEEAKVTPTWVNRYSQAGKTVFEILAMDDDSNWQENGELSAETMDFCRESYDRTMAIVGSGLEAANQYYAQIQAETEARLGVA